MLRYRKGGRWAVAAAVACTAATVVSGLVGPVSAGASSDTTSTNHTIVTVAGGGGPLIANFNPFSTTSSLNATSLGDLVFEPMYIVKYSNPDDVTPWLAKSWSFNTADTVLTVNLNSGITWSDGKPFSASDVAFTFNLLAKYPQFNVLSLPITSAVAVSPTQAKLTFSTDVATDFAEIGGIPIIPQHIWSTVGDPATYTDPDPVGTGPFELQAGSFSSQGYLLVRNPHYWQKDLQPKIYGVRLVSYDSNTSADLALENNEADWAGTYVPEVQKEYVDQNSDHHDWFPATGSDYLCPNDSLAKYQSVDVRKAISDAINRSEISIGGEQGELPPATNPTGLTMPIQEADLSAAYAHAKLTQNVKAAEKLLIEAGYHRGAGGQMIGANGQPLTVTLDVPSSWTDTLADFQIVTQELDAVGIKASVDSMSYQEWVSDLLFGHTDMTVCFSSLVSSSITPYNTMQVINGSLTKPVGQLTLTDTERYNNPTADALLKQYAATNNAAVQKHDLDGLEAIMVQQMPVIPFLYSVAWSEYSTAQVTGWPSASNPYAEGSPTGDNMLLVALHLKPVHSRAKQ